MSNPKNLLAERGFVHLKGALNPAAFTVLSEECQRLIARARAIMADTISRGVALADYYLQHDHEIIVVPEADQPQEPCRFEYIAQCSPRLNEAVIHPIQDLIEALMGEPFVLFKDKCNLKNPGGGAFPAHQDITAYQHFKPKFHITAAVAVDAFSLENGCLEMAEDYLKTYGSHCLLDHYEGGPRHGDIRDEISQTLTWRPILAKPSDIVLFNSFVPHRSVKNLSTQSRRTFFFTFNAAREGTWYQHYYAAKKRDYSNPMFHVSTPTHHRGQ